MAYFMLKKIGNIKGTVAKTTAPVCSSFGGRQSLALRDAFRLRAEIPPHHMLSGLCGERDDVFI